ncbi:MAG: 2-oxo acid dehydrogenase subunit E2 [Candidatus Brocadiae bacterium]|nr:2-oxo acid dehydrogenase subunit E2 [Candidatus Brocadiia bacterium]
MGRQGSILVKKLHRYRQLMPYLMPTRNESVVYYDTYIKAEELLRFLESVKDSNPKITLTHLLVKACAMGMYQHPTMNQYISGQRLYQKETVEISFSLKKEKVSHSPIKVLKMEIPQKESLQELSLRIQERLGVERSEKKTYTDKEIDYLSLLPRFLLRTLVKIVRALDYYNLLPQAFIKNDPLYASLFIANLGSIGLDPGYHHLYEYGTISIFCMAGKIKDMPIVEDGKIIAQKTLHIRWSYDERIDDGMSSTNGIATVVKILENPFEYFPLQ